MRPRTDRQKLAISRPGMSGNRRECVEGVGGASAFDEASVFLLAPFLS
jgi:hypothetical protein